MRSLFETAAQGHARLLCLTGEPGIGKSRIVRAFRDRIEGDQHKAVVYQCSPHHVNSALYPAIRQFEHMSGIAVGEIQEAKLDRLEALLQLANPEVSGTAPLIAALLSLQSQHREIVILRDYLDLSYAEIGDILGIAPGTVMSRLHRARLGLREALSNYER